MKLSKLILTEMVIRGRKCIVCAAAEEQKIMELRLEPSDKKNTLNNIYVGQIEKTAANIQAAFVRIGDGINGYLPLEQAKEAILQKRSIHEYRTAQASLARAASRLRIKNSLNN